MSSPVEEQARRIRDALEAIEIDFESWGDPDVTYDAHSVGDALAALDELLASHQQLRDGLERVFELSEWESSTKAEIGAHAVAVLDGTTLEAATAAREKPPFFGGGILGPPIGPQCTGFGDCDCDVCFPHEPDLTLGEDQFYGGEQSSPVVRKWAPELAYSWPVVVLVLTFPALFVSKDLALGCLVGAFVCCPIRDAILDRFWPDSP